MGTQTKAQTSIDLIELFMVLLHRHDYWMWLERENENFDRTDILTRSTQPYRRHLH